MVQTRTGGIRQSSGLAHFLKYDGIHASSEVLVIHTHDRRQSRIEFLSPVGNRRHVHLFRIVRSNQHPVGRGLLIDELFVVGHRRQLFGNAVLFIDFSHDIFQTQRSVIQNGMFILVQTFQTDDQIFRFQFFQFFGGQNIAGGRFRSVIGILYQFAEIGRLVQFRIDPRFLNIRFHILQHHRIRLGIGKQRLKQLHCLTHILAQSGQSDIHSLAARRNEIIAGQIVELLLDLLRSHFARSQIIQILHSRTQRLVLIGAHIEHIHHGKQIVRRILLVKHRNLRFRNRFVHVLGIIQEHRFYRLHLGSLYLAQERTGRIPVHEYRGNGRLGYFLFIRILPFALVHQSIVILEIGLREIHDLLFGNLAHLLQGSHLILPLDPIDERIDEKIRPGAVAFQLRLQITLVIINGSLN